jgi:GxxExxY protein
MSGILLFKDEVFRIIGAAIEVSKVLSSGYLEAVYQEALEIELSESNVSFEKQKKLKIHYKHRILTKEYIADFVCFDKIIIEIKAIKRLTTVEDAQILNYLKITGLPLGILINFGGSTMEWKRFANTKNN